jgi:hypothetical protein
MDIEQTQTDPQESAPRRRWWQKAPPPPPDPTIATIMAQWGEYELIFNDILTRLNAQLARQAKMQKRAFEKVKLEGEQEAVNGPSPAIPTVPAFQSPKQALRSAYASQRFGARVQAIVSSKED